MPTLKNQNQLKDISFNDCVTTCSKVIFSFVSNGEKSRLSAKAIHEDLVENQRVNVSLQSINSVLGKNKKYFHKGSEGYMLMDLGRKKLEEIMEQKNNIYIEPNTPYKTRNVILKDLADKLTGYALITDPYLDQDTISLIYRSFQKKFPIRLLTSTVKNNVIGTITSAINEINREGFLLEVKVYDKSELHDRYIIDQKDIWILGSSLNGLGNKESFILKFGSDIRSSMEETFNRRWKASKTF